MTKTHLPPNIQDAIVSAAKPFNPYEVILFGSYAYGEPHKDSDIDVLFVSNEDGYKSFEERIAMKMEVLKSLRGIEIPIDILAYTKQEWEELIAKKSSFIREINMRGVRLETDAK